MSEEAKIKRGFLHLKKSHDILKDLMPYGIEGSQENGVVTLKSCGCKSVGEDICTALIKLKETIQKENN